VCFSLFIIIIINLCYFIPTPQVKAIFDSEDIIWEDGFEDGRDDFPSWDQYYTGIAPSEQYVQTTTVRGGSYACRFSYDTDGKSCGLFDHTHLTDWESGDYYWSFWVYIPSNVEDFFLHSGIPNFAIGGLKWYFLDYKWNQGLRFHLYWSGGSSRVRLDAHIGGHINSGAESPQTWGGVSYSYTKPDYWEDWFHWDVNYGTWNHLQVFLKCRVDASGEWRVWVNDSDVCDEGTARIVGVKTHPDGFLSPVPPADFYSQDNKYPHAQIMYYHTGGTIYDGYFLIDDCVIATEKVTETYTVDYPSAEFSSFYNGFEEGDFSVWNGTNQGGGGDTPSIITNPVCNGTYAMNVTTDGADNSYARVKKQFQGVDEVYARAWVRFPELPDTNNTRIMVVNVQKDGGTYIASAGVYNMSGNYYWCIHVGADPANPPSNYTLSTINVDTWYCVELYFNATTNGNATVWINDVLKCEVTGDFSGHNPIAEVLPYIYVAGAQSSTKTVIHDNFGVDSSHIGMGNPIIFKTSLTFLSSQEEPSEAIPNVLINGTSPTDETGTYVWYDLALNHIYCFVVEKPVGYYPAWCLNVEGSFSWNTTHYLLWHNVTEDQTGYININFFASSQPYINATDAKKLILMYPV